MRFSGAIKQQMYSYLDLLNLASTTFNSIFNRYHLLFSRGFLFLSPLLLLQYPSNSHALSATTRNVIEGSKPYFTLNGKKLNSTNELAGFSYSESSSSNSIINVDVTQSIEVSSSNAILIPSDIKENDIVAIAPFATSNALTPTSLNELVKTESHPLKVDDEDGDASDISAIGAKGTILVVMKKNGNTITPGNHQFSSCNDYRLEIKIAESGTPAGVAATTIYGYPNESKADYVATSATYKLKSSNRNICYLAPANLTIRASNTASYPYDVGYTYLWEGTSSTNSKGFKVSEMISSGNKFPQTGFKGAKFTVVGSGDDQSNYECKVIPTDAVIQSSSNGTGSNCIIEYASVDNPGSITIELYHKPTSTATPVDTYVTPVPQLWAKVKGNAKFNTDSSYLGTYPAANLCAGGSSGLSGSSATTRAAAASYFFSRRELTNSRNATESAPTYIVENFIRDVSLTEPSILGEWGDVYSDNSYANSGFNASKSIWTGEYKLTTSSPTQFFLYSNNGNILNSYPHASYLTVCR